MPPPQDTEVEQSPSGHVQKKRTTESWLTLERSFECFDTAKKFVKNFDGFKLNQIGNNKDIWMYKCAFHDNCPVTLKIRHIYDDGCCYTYNRNTVVSLRELMTILVIA